MADPVMGAVRIVHIVSGVAMGGGALLWSLVIAPSLNRGLAPPAISATMKAVLPHFARYMNAVAALAVLSGLTLLSLLVGARNVPAVLTSSTAYGTFLLVGLLLVMTTFVVGNLGIARNVSRMLKLGDQQPPPPGAAEAMRRLGRKVTFFAALDVALVLGILMAMASAVHVRG